MELRNRIVMAPMVVNYGAEDGQVSEQTIAYYEERAKGGVGLIIVEATSIDLSRNKCWLRQLSIDDDRFIPGMSQLVGTIQKHGARVALQLHHGGSVSRRDLTPLPPVSSSAVGYKDAYIKSERKDPPVELTPAEISDMVHLFARAAGRAQQAGFDGIEVHAAHGYLIGQFLSAAKNKRQDAYGGSLRNRARFLVEIIEGIRDVVGTNYPLWCRLSAEETGLEGGITIAETKELCRILRDTRLDAIHVSGVPPIRTFYSPPGYFVEFASEIKNVAGCPVIASGGIDAELGEQILQENKTDLVAMGRALLADPELPLKVAIGNAEDIRPCLCDSMCRDCISYHDTPVTCTVNARTGKEKEFVIEPAKKAKRIAIVGGGPAGMEAARIAAERGHDVTIYEREPVLGGQLVPAAVTPNKELIEKFRKYLIRQNQKLGVNVVLDKEVSLPLLEETRPDVVVIATGSRAVPPKIPGIDRDNVFSVEDVLNGRARIGENVVIMGGGMTGCETAHYLAQQGRKVTVIEMLETIAQDLMPSTVRSAMLEVLKKGKVNVQTGMEVAEITEDGVAVSDKTGQHTIHADTIVLATGRKANRELYQVVGGIIPDVYLIGDARQPGLITEAMATAFRTALSI